MPYNCQIRSKIVVQWFYLFEHIFIANYGIKKKILMKKTYFNDDVNQRNRLQTFYIPTSATKSNSIRYVSIFQAKNLNVRYSKTRNTITYIKIKNSIIL